MAKKTFFYNGFTVTKKVFQRCLNGYKKVVSTVKKKVFPQCFTVKKRCYSGVSTVKKSCFDSENEVIPQWFYSDKKGVSTVFERLQKQVVSTVSKKRGFHSYFTVKKRRFDNLSIVVFPP